MTALISLHVHPVHALLETLEALESDLICEPSAIRDHPVLVADVCLLIKIAKSISALLWRRRSFALLRWEASVCSSCRCFAALLGDRCDMFQDNLGRLACL